jgi:hypothetical protein
LGEPLFRKPITGIGFCCARAASGHAIAAPAVNRTNSRRLMLGLSIRWRAGNMAEQSHLRYVDE